MPQQFENPANIEVHRRTTAAGDPRATSPRASTYLITGVGTGGHITGASEVLKQHWPKLQTFAVEPAKSPVISGGAPEPAPDPGHRRRLRPGQPAPGHARRGHPGDRGGRVRLSRVRAAKEEGIFVGPSSGASLAAVAQKIPELPDGSRVLTFCYDTGERYLSVEGLFTLPS